MEISVLVLEHKPWHVPNSLLVMPGTQHTNYRLDIRRVVTQGLPRDTTPVASSGADSVTGADTLTRRHAALRFGRE